MKETTKSSKENNQKIINERKRKRKNCIERIIGKKKEII